VVLYPQKPFFSWFFTGIFFAPIKTNIVSLAPCQQYFSQVLEDRRKCKISFSNYLAWISKNPYISHAPFFKNLADLLSEQGRIRDVRENVVTKVWPM
jgi:hypothetical protein